MRLVAGKFLVAMVVFFVLMGLWMVVPSRVHGAVALYEAQAQALQEMGLLRGTASGFNLERVPTRAEAAVMLVRLLGKEDEALELKFPCPFTDVPDWAQPYVGYMLRYNLTTGVGNNLYGSSRPVSANAYATFILRSLGYSDQEGDFIWSSAISFAEKVGFGEGVPLASFERQVFRRNEMVMLSWLALSSEMKNRSGTLVEALVKNGVVAHETARRTGSIPQEEEWTISIQVLEDGNKRFSVLYSEMEPDVRERISYATTTGNYALPPSHISVSRLAVMTHAQIAALKEGLQASPFQRTEEKKYSYYGQYQYIIFYNAQFRPIYIAELPPNLPVGEAEITMYPMDTGRLGNLTAQAAVEVEEITAQGISGIVLLQPDMYRIETRTGTSGSMNTVFWIVREKLPASLKNFHSVTTSGVSQTDAEAALKLILLRRWQAGGMEQVTAGGPAYDDTTGVVLQYQNNAIYLHDMDGCLIGFTLVLK